jgi:hypothetical protein
MADLQKIKIFVICLKKGFRGHLYLANSLKAFAILILIGWGQFNSNC